MSASFPERVTKSHLSRIENGHAVPSFPRLFALCRIYGVPIAAMAERLEVEWLTGGEPLAAVAADPEGALAEATALIRTGRYQEALQRVSGALEEAAVPVRDARPDPTRVRLRLFRVDCLVHLGRLEAAKAETEEILSHEALDDAQRLVGLQFFVICCFRLGRYPVAHMAFEHARSLLDRAGVPLRMRADLEAIGGNILVASDRCSEAVALYEAALAIYVSLPNPFEACRTRVNMAVAMLGAGRREDAERELLAVLPVAETGGYDRPRALALSTLAAAALDRGDHDAAEAYALKSNAIARPREYLPFVFRNCYVLWKIARTRGDAAAVRANERTLRAYVGKIEEPMREVDDFRAFLGGGER